MSQENLLEVKHLRTEFFSSKKSSVTAVDDVNFEIKGEIVGSRRRVRLWKKRYLPLSSCSF